MSEGGFGASGDNAFDSGDMAAALSTTSKVIPEQNFIGAPQDKQEAESKARDHGYTAPIPYDYSAYQPGNAAKPVGADGDGDDILAPITGGIAAQAVRYEWKDEYGDVGPKIPELEAILFTDEFKYEAGTQRGTIQGIKSEAMGKDCDANFPTIGKVRISHVFMINTSNLHCSSKMLVSTQLLWRP
jgi:hypothetical protein